MKKHLSLLFFLLTTSFLFSQTFTLENGTDKKEFKPKGFYEIILAENEEMVKKDCCDWTELKGQLITIDSDSFELKVTEYNRRTIINDTRIIREIYDNKSGTNSGRFATADVFSLKNYKSEKNHKIKKNGFVVTAGLLLFTGLVTAANAFIVDKGSNRENILISSGTQLGASLIFGIASSKKEYKLKGENTEWKIKK